MVRSLKSGLKLTKTRFFSNSHTECVHFFLSVFPLNLLRETASSSHMRIWDNFLCIAKNFKSGVPVWLPRSLSHTDTIEKMLNGGQQTGETLKTASIPWTGYIVQDKEPDVPSESESYNYLTTIQDLEKLQIIGKSSPTTCVTQASRNYTLEQVPVKL